MDDRVRNREKADADKNATVAEDRAHVVTNLAVANDNFPARGALIEGKRVAEIALARSDGTDKASAVGD